MRTTSCPPCITSVILFTLPRKAPYTRCITTSASLPAQVQHVELPRILTPPGSIHHNSLPTFLEYAKRVDLKPTRSVYVGTHFEYTTAISLLRLGFSLFRTGGKDDLGIDLIGHWVLPQFPQPMPVIVQCKARKPHVRCAPRHIRELQGAFQGIPHNWQRKDVLAVLVTSHNASSGVLESLKRNRWPMGFLNISRDGNIEQFVWNRAASDRGLEGVGVTVRHTPLALLGRSVTEAAREGVSRSLDRPRKYSGGIPEDSGTKKDIVLTWMGDPIFPDRETLHDDPQQLMRQIIADDQVVVAKRTLAGEAAAAVVKRKRGRPKKIATQGAVVKRTRGRPKEITTEGLVVKRPRGRPSGSKNKKTLAVEAQLAALRKAP